MDRNDSQRLFAEEAERLLSEFDGGLLLLEKKNDPLEALNRLSLTIKLLRSRSSALGLQRLVAFTQVVEVVLERLHQGELRVESLLVKLLRKSRDHLRELVAVAFAGDERNNLSNAVACNTGPKTRAASSCFAKEASWLFEWDLGFEQGAQGRDPLALLRTLKKEQSARRRTTASFRSLHRGSHSGVTPLAASISAPVARINETIVPAPYFPVTLHCAVRLRRAAATNGICPAPHRRQ